MGFRPECVLLNFIGVLHHLDVLLVGVSGQDAVITDTELL